MQSAYQQLDESIVIVHLAVIKYSNNRSIVTNICLDVSLYSIMTTDTR
jgi:hypothetical protein